VLICDWPVDRQLIHYCSRQPLHLSAFTLDEFEHAIRHSVIDPPCQLLAEIHSTLIYNLRTIPFLRHSAVVSLLRLKDGIDVEDEKDDTVLGVSIETLTTAMAEVGNNWERVPLRHAECREGWEDAMVGCLKDVSSHYHQRGSFVDDISHSMPLWLISLSLGRS
jgi:hypothetical protein